MLAGFAGRHVLGFGDFSIDVFLEVQNQRCRYILYLINYIAYGLRLWYNIYFVKEICRKTMSIHPGLGSSLDISCPYWFGSVFVSARSVLHNTLHETHLGNTQVFDFLGAADLKPPTVLLRVPSSRTPPASRLVCLPLRQMNCSHCFSP